MPCFHRIRAWKLANGGISLREPRVAGSGATFLQLPCGTCIGCRQSRARDWMVRCGLELSARPRESACWATLTYSDEYVPPTLCKGHLSGWVKRLRDRVAPRRFRFFGCGEYGEKGGRPHYHCILFGLSQDDQPAVEESWGMGFTQVDRLEPAAIAYVAGYTAKKLGVWERDWIERGAFEVLDRSSGEITEGFHRNVIWQAPFLLMSRRPGIGGDARVHWRSWRSTAIWDGKEVRVPRFLHEAYKENASQGELEELERERSEFVAAIPADAKLREKAGEVIALRKFNLKMEQRRKL